MRVKHHRAVLAHPFPRFLDRLHQRLNVGGIAGRRTRSTGGDLVSLGRGINADPVAGRATHQSINRHAMQFAGDVPQGHVDARNRVQHEGAAAIIPVRAIQFLPEMLDARWVLAVEQFKHRLHERLRDRRWQLRNLAPAENLLIGFDFQQRLAADRVGLEAGDLDRRRAVDKLSRRVVGR